MKVNPYAPADLSGGEWAHLNILYIYTRVTKLIMNRFILNNVWVVAELGAAVC